MRRFYRLSGGGNDFLGLTDSHSEPTADEIRALCRRGVSAGADGLFILQNRRDRVGMRYFNADGREAELCLNGTRCAVALARHLGWVRDPVEIETEAGVFRGTLNSEGEVALELPRPERPQRVSVDHEGIEYQGWFLTVGVPHFVLPWLDGLTEAPVAELGPPLRSHPDWGASGANVDFVHCPHPHRLEIRTFERGVEAETLACGTGVLASVAVGLESNELELPVTALTLGGFELEVAAVGTAAWSLTGDARLVAEGTLLRGAFTLPEPPVWT